MAYLLLPFDITSLYFILLGDDIASWIKYSTLSYLSFGPLCINQNRFNQSCRLSLSKPPWALKNLFNKAWSLFISYKGLSLSFKFFVCFVG